MLLALVRKAVLASAGAAGAVEGAVVGDVWLKAAAGSKETTSAMPAAKGIAKPGRNMKACFLRGGD